MKNEGSLLSFRRIYYRGKLNSCNYTCSYCPFGKKSHLADTTQDEQAWNRFIAAIEQWKGEPLQLFIIPYGEALIHRYYRKGMMHLAALLEFPVRLTFLFRLNTGLMRFVWLPL